jgi:tetratricopeptide (TPR) repeat protein
MRRPILAGAWLVLVLLAPAPARAEEVPLPGVDDSLSPQELSESRRDTACRRAEEYLLRFRRDDAGQAIRIYGQVLRRFPDFAPAWGGLSEARAMRYLLGWDPDPAELERALREGRTAVEKGPERWEAHLGLGLAHLAAEQTTPALAAMDRALELGPESFRVHLHRGLLMHALRRAEDLAVHVDRLFAIDPDSPAAYALQGDYFQDRGQFARAREAYEIAVQLDQRFLWPRLGLAAAFQRDRNYAAAGKVYQITAADFPEEETWWRILGASQLVATQQYEAALEAYAAIPDDRPVSPPLLRRLRLAGRALSLERLGRLPEAEFYWSRLVEGLPDDFDGAVRDREVVSQGVEGLVRYHEGKGDPARAREILERACSRRGMDFRLHVNLANRYREERRHAQAMEVLLAGARGASPDLDLVTATLETLPLLREAVSEPADAAARRPAGELLEELNRRLEAAGSATYVPYLNLARAAARLGQTDRAVGLVRKAVEKGYARIGEIRRDPDLKPIAGHPEIRSLKTARP